MRPGRRGADEPGGGAVKGRAAGGAPSGMGIPAAAMLGTPGGRDVVILAHRDHPRAVTSWLGQLAADRVTVVYLGARTKGHPAEDPKRAAIEAGDGLDLGRQLAGLGPLDVIVVTVPSKKLPTLAKNHFDLVPHLLFHLRPGGALAIDRTVGKGGTNGLAPEHWRRLLGREGPVEPTSRSFRKEALTRSTRSLYCSRRYIVVTKRHRHYYKLGEDRVDQVLAAREPELGVSTLATLPSGVTQATQTEQMYGQHDLEPLPARLDLPAMVLRHYQGPLGSEGHSLLHAEHTVLPESFRWPWETTRNHPRGAEVSDDFLEMTRPTKRTLAGDYYFLDCLFPGHFGHLLTEVVGRLWGWEQAKQQMPDLKALFHFRNFPGLRGDLERELFLAYGIAESDLVASRWPVHLNSVVGASPMWHNRAPFYAHPEIHGTWDRLTSGLLAGNAPSRHERVFVSRGQDVAHRRGCRNQTEVEKVFADRGFLVFYPEQHSLSEQVAVFAGARVVAGFAGSAMFNLMHSRRLEAVVVLSHSAYIHRNEHLYARLHGAQLYHFWSPHEEAETADARALARASWSFDFPELGHDLDQVLTGL